MEELLYHTDTADYDQLWGDIDENLAQLLLYAGGAKQLRCLGVGALEGCESIAQVMLSIGQLSQIRELELEGWDLTEASLHYFAPPKFQYHFYES